MDTATTEIYTLSLHDALPICTAGSARRREDRRQLLEFRVPGPRSCRPRSRQSRPAPGRSEEHTSELQSLRHLVCRLLLEKKKNTQDIVKEETNRPSPAIPIAD